MARTQRIKTAKGKGGKSKMLGSLTEVAAALGVSQPAVSQWKARHPSCPLRKPAPWSLDEIRAWHSATMRSGGPPLPYVDPGDDSNRGNPAAALQVEMQALAPDRRARAMHLLQRIQIEKFDHEVLKGNFIALPAVRDERKRRATVFRTVMESLPRLIRNHPELDSVDRDALALVERVAEAVVHEALTRMASSASRSEKA